MLASIKDTDGSVGFIPFGYVMSGSDRAYLAGIEDVTPANITLEKVTEAVREDNETLYPGGLRPPLYYVTNGQPSTICDAFITWVCSPEGQLILREEGYVSLY
jgi:ABC-type phosphate transport system substrate-binding protein